MLLWSGHRSPQYEAARLHGAHGAVRTRDRMTAPATSELQELTRLLLDLLEAAQRLPEGPERQAALKQINDFQQRLAKFIPKNGGRDEIRR